MFSVANQAKEPAIHSSAFGSQPDVSVVIPSYNRIAILPRCLDALARQTHQRFEVIVVDDASTDGTLEYLERWAEEHPEVRLRWLVNESNLGANASRNRAIAIAAGDLVALLDSDCIPRPAWLEKLSAGFSDGRVGSVTGKVLDPIPTNIFELALKGMNRVHGELEAKRLVAGNMCVRRDFLLSNPLDEDLKYGCDEEGTYVRLRAAGYRQLRRPQAIVLHDHRYNAGSFFHLARVGGSAAAWFVYKYRLPPRLDILPFALAYLFLAIALIDIRGLWVFALLFAAAIVALAYNELFRKRKNIGEALASLPMLLAYYQVRVAAYLAETALLYTGLRKIERVRLDALHSG